MPGGREVRPFERRRSQAPAGGGEPIYPTFAEADRKLEKRSVLFIARMLAQQGIISAEDVEAWVAEWDRA